MTTQKPGLAAQATVTPATAVAFTEGPAVDADGSVYFSDIDITAGKMLFTTRVAVPGQVAWPKF